MNTHTTHCGP